MWEGGEGGFSGAEHDGGGMTRTDGSNVVVDVPPRKQGISRREGDQPIQKSEYTKK